MRKRDCTLRACVHGSAVLVLLSDFLCDHCQVKFLETAKLVFVDREAVDVAIPEVGPWASALLPGSSKLARVGLTRELLVEELKRFWLRHCAMEHAADHVEGAFDAFSSCFDDPVFGADAFQRILRLVPRRQVDCIAKRLFREGDGTFGLFYGRRFGMARAGCTEWLAPAVLRCPGVEPESWRDYTGRPGGCCPELWCLRAWVVAKGGIASLRDKERLRLLFLEEARDVFYMAFRDGGVHFAVDLRPGGEFPSLSTWMESCAVLRKSDRGEVMLRIRELHDAICLERCKLGFCVNTGCVHDEMEVLSVLEARGSSVTFELERWQSGNGGAFPCVGSGCPYERQIARNVVRAIAEHRDYYLRIWSERSVADWFALAWPDLYSFKESSDVS